jgi:hypothetical protein
MPIPTLITDLSQTAGSNYPAGSDSPSVLDDVQRAHAGFIAQLRDGKGQSTPLTLASATTTDIGGQNSQFVEISGTTTITSLGTNYTGVRYLRFTGVLTLTHNSTALNINGGVSIVTVAGDTAIAIPNTALNGWNVFYVRNSAAPGGADYLNTLRIDVASAATTDLTANAPNTRNINITGTTTITAFTIASGQTYFVRFNAALTLTNNGSIVTQTGSNITTAAGDTCIIRSTAANVIEVLSYVTAPSAQIQTISGSVASNALTIGAGALTLGFRSTTLTSGTITTVSGTPSNLVVPSGATLGTVSAIASSLAVLALNNAGTIELAVINLSGGNDLTETGLISTTAISAGSASASVAYSTTARTNVAYRVIGRIDSTQTTAGTWATTPSLIQGAGGQALTAMSSLGYSQTWQNLTGSRTIGTTYYNTTGRPISVSCFLNGGSAGYAVATVNGVNIPGQQANAAGSVVLYVTFIVPPQASYSATISTSPTSINSWQELR